jgi:hypothetical protein
MKNYQPFKKNIIDILANDNSSYGASPREEKKANYTRNSIAQ